MWSFPCAALLAASCVAGVFARDWAVGQGVQTTSGFIQGHASTKVPSVSEYLGIRFAQAATGALRFAKPQPYTSNETFVANQFSPDCPGKLSAPTGVLDALSSFFNQKSKADEDCLSINIYTQPQSGAKSKAVLLWIYGGGFNVGTSNAPLFDGARFAAEEDVVLVTFNYRLTIFGFPNGPSGLDNNLGLLDQRLATEWVRDNIAGFGGDPRKITIFGESAGGGSVDMYAYAWADKEPIVNGFIAESGTAFMKGLVPPAATSEAWFKVSSALGCGGETSGMASVECMRKKTYEEIITAVNANTNGDPITSPFMPAPDGKVVFNDYEARAHAGRFIKRPILVGNNDNEAGFFKIMAGFGGKEFDKKQLDQLNLGFSCPAGLAADVRRLQGINSWRYRYSGAFPNSRMIPNSGAVHGSEISLVFGNMMALGIPGKVAKSTPDEESLSTIMRHGWAEFARNPEQGLTALGWPAYDPKGKTLIQLGLNNTATITLAQGNAFDADCDTWERSSPVSLVGP